MKHDAPLHIEQLVKYFGALCAVDHISLSLKKGEIFGLLGPNGAGKTTLISIIAALEKAHSGSVHIFGLDIHKKPRAAKLKLGVVPQELVSHGYFTVTEVLHHQSGYYGIKNNLERIHYLLKKLDLWQQRDKRASTLSGGMKRRLMIAQALVHNPPLLLLDEPTEGVDVELRNELWNFIRELNAAGMTVLLTTHYLNEAEALCNRIGIIYQGHLKLVDSTQAVVNTLTNRTIILHLKAPLKSKIESPYLIQQKERELIFRLPQKMYFGELFEAAKIDITLIKDIKIQEGTLEDAFLHVVGNHGAITC